jgi:hypothetical protein
MKAQFSLTTSESKRLIGKSVSQHPKVKKALQKGILAVGLGSANAFVVEEILKKKIEKERYVAGYIDGRGPCVVPAKERLPEVVLKNGKVVKDRPAEIVKKMKATDVFIKGANALDPEGIAGVMMASELGGTIADVLGIIKARGVNLIVPIGLEKLIPYSINDISNVTGIFEIDDAIGIPVGIMPVAGEVITEIEALDSLRVNAIAIGSGGLGSGEGSKTFQIEGDAKNVKHVLNAVKKIKGEKRVEALRGICKTCTFKHCRNFRKR